MTENILKEFPKFELSYNTIVSKKVPSSSYNVMMAIPFGVKGFAWFRFNGNIPVCYFLECGQKTDTICDIKILQTSFDKSLCTEVGTILYGTLFKVTTQVFCVENVLYSKGNNVSSDPFGAKLHTVSGLFSSDLNGVVFNDKQTIFGMPLAHTDWREFLALIDALPYKIHSILFKSFNTKASYSLLYKKSNSAPPVENKVFNVTADIDNDIYYLHKYDFKTKQEEFVGYALVPDYKTSVYMNGIFRSIKENVRLDSLEESDDEEEFENDKPDKFVNLAKRVKMVCKFNDKFKKWIPISIATK